MPGKKSELIERMHQGLIGAGAGLLIGGGLSTVIYDHGKITTTNRMLALTGVVAVMAGIVVFVYDKYVIRSKHGNASKKARK